MKESQPSLPGGRSDARPDKLGQPSYDAASDHVSEPEAVQAHSEGAGGDRCPVGQPSARMPSYAHWVWRVGAALIDGATIYIPERILRATFEGYAGAMLGTIVGLLILLILCYFVGMTGRTPGKAAVRIRLVREANGSSLGFGLAVGRWFLHILDAISCGIGYLWPMWDEKRQTFADKVVHSVVLKD